MDQFLNKHLALETKLNKLLEENEKLKNLVSELTYGRSTSSEEDFTVICTNKDAAESSTKNTREEELISKISTMGPSYAEKVKEEPKGEMFTPVTHHRNNYFRNFYTLVQYLSEPKSNIAWMSLISWRNFNKAVIYTTANPDTVRNFYDYGLLHCIYPSLDHSELSRLPNCIQQSARRFQNLVKTKQIYVRFYQTIPEFGKDQSWLQPMSIVKFGTTQEPLLMEEQAKPITEDELWDNVPQIKAVSMKVLYEELKMAIESPHWEYYFDNRNLIYSKSSQEQINRPRKIEAWYRSFLEGKVMASDEARRQYCRLMLSEEKHYCPDCKKNTPVADTTVKKLVLPMG